VDVLAAAEVVPQVCRLMAAELGWGSQRIEAELQATEKYLNSCGLQLKLAQLASGNED